MEIILNGSFRLFFQEIYNEKVVMSETRVLHQIYEFGKALGNKMFSYFFVAFQWLLIVVILVFNLHFSVAVASGLANGALKVVMSFHVLMLLFPAISCCLFLRLRKQGIVERCILALSAITVLLSIVNISLHFVNNLVLLMKTSEVAAWSLYSIIFSLSVYKISYVYLIPIWRRNAEIGKSASRNSKNLWTEDQKCEKPL